MGAWLTWLWPACTRPSRGIFSPGRTMTMSPIVTASMASVRSAPSRRTSASAGARSISARIAPRARSIARDSSTCARAKRNTTDAPSAHSPSAIAPATATIIRTWMSSRPARRDVQARRAVCVPERTTAATYSHTHTRGAAPHSWSASPPARHAPARTTSRSRHERSGGRTRLLVLEPGAHPGLRDGFGNPRGRELGGVVLDPQALAHHVGVERLEPGERLETMLEDRDFLVAVHALDLEDRLGVQLANRTVEPFPGCSSTCVSACLSSSMMW